MSHTQSSAAPIGAVAADIYRRATTRRPTRSGAQHRTGAPVRRDSLEAGTFEDTFFVAPAQGETDRILLLARKALDEGRRLRRLAREPGRELSARERTLAALTGAAVRVLEEVLMIARVCKGEVYPSYDHLVTKTHLGRRTIARVLHILEAAGFLVRQRRFTRIEAEREGPRYRQTSNAYRPLMPAKLAALLPRWARPAPTPPDFVQHEADRREEHAGMLASLTCRELARATLSGPLADAFARLGASVDKTECEC